MRGMSPGKGGARTRVGGGNTWALAESGHDGLAGEGVKERVLLVQGDSCQVRMAVEESRPQNHTVVVLQPRPTSGSKARTGVYRV